MNGWRGITAVALAVFAGRAGAQPRKPEPKPPEPGYLFPPGGPAGTTIDVVVGGYDWTPDTDVFVLDPGPRLALAGELGPVLVPPPPYWFGPKSTTAPLPLPRERPGRLTLPAGLRPGPVRWALANANGAGARTGLFWVGDGPEVVERQADPGPHLLPPPPVTVNGRLVCNEEVDRYRFRTPADGPVTCELFARRLGADLNGSVVVRDARGRAVADAVDTAGRDVAVTFAAAAGAEYTVEVSDFDFRGDRSFVYRLAVTPGPRVVAAVPAAVRRGETREVEFVGYGVASGRPVLESARRRVAAPADRTDSIVYRLRTPYGDAPAFDLPLSDQPEGIAAGLTTPLSLPFAVTGVLDGPADGARVRFNGRKGEAVRLAAEARRFGSPLDLTLVLLGPDGKEVGRSDDLPGTTDAGLAVTLPADGAHTAVVSDLAGATGTRATVFRLTGERQTPDFHLTTAGRVNVPVGGTVDLTVKAERVAGFADPIAVTVAGLPPGVSVPAGLVIPAGGSELTVRVACAADAATTARVLTVTGDSAGHAQPALAPLTAGPADAGRTAAILLATTLAPRVRVAAVEADGGRKVHRGSTHPAEVVVERLAGYTGEVRLQMSAAQSYQRQGITGPDLPVPPGADRTLYPCFMPEWLETTRTSRMELVGVTRVADPAGRVRHLVTPMHGRITMSIEGAMLKVEAGRTELTVGPGEVAVVPVTVQRSAKLAEPVRLELVVPDALAGRLSAAPVVVPAGRTDAKLRITAAPGWEPEADYRVAIRGTALQGGRYPVVSEASLTVEARAQREGK